MIHNQFNQYNFLRTMMSKSFTVRAIVACIAFTCPSTSTAEKTRSATRTDLTECKLTQFGTEYQGPKATTGGGIRCQFWHAEEPLHKISSEIKDNDFPERSMRLAKNYCRNPTRDPKGPWCYTTEPTLIDDECGIPLCNFGECRVSGTGAEYSGGRKTSVSGKKCKSWDKRHKLAEGRTEKFSNKNFPELSRDKAGSFCRNPNDDTGGPWCYVEEENYETVEREYCDVPFCDDKDCLVYARNFSVYSTLTRLNETYGNITFWIKLWNPMDEQDGEARLLLSLVPIPASAKKIAQEWKAGVEIVISNAGTGQVYPTAEDEQDLESTPNILLGSKWSGFWMNWGGGFVSVGSYGSAKPLFLDEYKKKNTISSLYPDSFLYYGIMGTGVLWSTAFCQEKECTFLVKGHGVGRRLYVLPEHRSEGLHFSLKAWEPDQPDSITFVFTADDGLKSRYILKVGALGNEKVMLYYQGEEGGIEMVKKKTLPHLLYLGKWSNFVIRIPRGKVLVYYQGAPNPLFQWDHTEPEKAFLPIYYYYTSELGHTIGVAFDCATRCHIENTQTERFSRILPLSIWSKSGVSNPNRLELMIRAEGVVLIPLLLLPATPGYYALTLGELGQWVFFLKNTYPNVRIFHKQKAPSALFTANSWTNFTIMWFNSTINVLWNGTQVFHYEHTTPLIFYFFSLAVDRGGWATWAANCIPSDIDGDPEDGGWSEWGPWACSASCNGGVGTRKRVCNNPEPNVKGEPCLGPNIMSGRCNTIVCGDITEDTVSLIKRRIRRNHTSLSVKEGHEITIPSDPDIIKAISTESPDSDIEWSHNGIFVYPDNERLEIEEHNIVIKKAEVNDSGVYTITLHRVDGTHMIFKMVTLVVYPVKSVVNIRETLPMTITCHCVILGYLYSDLKISWTIGQDLWKDYGTTLPVSVNVDIVPGLNVSHKGLWECVVEQDDLGFKWITNAILVNVLGPPNWRTHLMEDKLTRPIFGWMPNETFVAVSALVIFLIATACIVVGTGFYMRFRESGKYRGSIEARNAEPTEKSAFRSSTTRDVKTVATQHEEAEESYDDRIVKSTRERPRSKNRRLADRGEKPERRKLMTTSDTESS